MQKAKPAHFVERVLLQHSAFLLQSKYEQNKDFLDDFPENSTDKERHERDYGSRMVKNEKGSPVTDRIEYIMYDLTQFSISKDKIRTDEERWLYLLKTAGISDNLPDFNDRIIANAIKRLLVKTASEKRLREQARNMVMTEEELDYLASIKVRAEEKGKAEGPEKGSTQTLADSEAVLRKKGLPESLIAEIQSELEKLWQSRLTKK